MVFHGLFVGIDRYASPDIDELACARRDAVALHALFSDTLGDGAALLIDDQATRANIADQFARLAACAEDDVVVIAFSGHGSETHELVTHDADIDDLAGTAIPLDTLTEWFARIPARRLVCILDCCFSGGMGAKMLKVEHRPRSLASAAHRLDQLSGDGRLILTASAATEPAWENQRLGHGLLTHHLLEALQGAEEARQGGKVAIYRLLDYVAGRVSAAAAAIGKVQRPALRGQLDGRLTWPVFTPGARYLAHFPERGRAAATPDVQSLAAFGFPPPVLAAWAGAIPALNALQLAAINEFGLLDGEHLVVSAPTSSGKTMIGELAALKGALTRKRAAFLLPLKALVNDKYQQFARTYGPFGIRTIRATGEIVDDIPALMRGQYDLCLLTYEKFAALVLGSPHLLDHLGTIVVDEVQMIADASRGVNLEFLLTLLCARRRQGIEPQLVALSAVIGDTNGLEGWLGGRLLRRTERPVPLDEGLLLADGSFRFVDPDGREQARPALIWPEHRKGSSQDWIIPLVRRLVSEGGQVIVFREQRGEARGCARYLARELGLPPARAALDALPAGDPSLASQALREALAGGVAFHVSDLDRDERLVIEEQFRAPGTTLRVIAATTTLAMGVNTPASAVVIAGLEHPGGVPYAVAEYKNIAGRAGRLGFAERGTSYLLALDPREEGDFWARYVTGAPEDLRSRFFAPGGDPRSLVIRVLAATERSAGRGLTAEEVVDFLEGSFGAFQQRHLAQGRRLDRGDYAGALDDLAGHGMVERAAAGAYQLTELGRLAGEGGIEVESIVRLVETLSRLEPARITDPALLAAVQLTVELDRVYIPINKRSTHQEPQTWQAELQRQGVPPHLLQALRRTREPHDGTARAKRAAACLLWVAGLPLTDIERSLTRHGGVFDGAAGPLRGVAARSVDLLPIVARVAELLHPGLELAARAARLLIRLEVGVPAPAVDLAAQAGTGLARGDYLALAGADLVGVDALEASPDEPLLSALGGSPEKLAEVRRAVQAHRRQEATRVSRTPILPPYEA